VPIRTLLGANVAVYFPGMAQVITVSHLYELDGSGTKYGKTLAYFEDRPAAETAAKKLGHYFFEIDDKIGRAHV
jgi:hypothetical protein